jgi:plasmid stabilization system protein ParE
MSRLIWSPAALQDMQRLHRFLASKNPDSARRAIAAVRKGVKTLQTQPALGRTVAGMCDEFRELIIEFGRSGYVVRYRIGGDATVVLAIRHQKEAGF